jgi:hypothetical protein
LGWVLPPLRAAAASGNDELPALILRCSGPRELNLR